MPFADMHFFDLPSLLKPDDVMVINESKVIPARLFASSKDGEGQVKPLEILLLRQIEQDAWEVLTRPGKRAKIGTAFSVGERLFGRVLDVTETGNRIVRFDYDHTDTFFSILEEQGNMPLPPYITQKCPDPSRYQTVYARFDGSAAAPTAGLHFTSALLQTIKNMGVTIAPVTLHVGLGTFRPVKQENIHKHIMHSEYYEVPTSTAEIVNRAKVNGQRVIAVGTTSLRTLEGASDEKGILQSGTGKTSIFIHPGYTFKIPDVLITNFHLPESTLMMLICAFMGYNEAMSAYQHAIQHKYRFFSFGDANYLEKKHDITL
jgi:S-adenosylmethionine:tRNA ribosyltransferase-isomerase